MHDEKEIMIITGTSVSLQCEQNAKTNATDHTNLCESAHKCISNSPYAQGLLSLAAKTGGPHTIAAKTTPTAHVQTVAEINAIVNNMLMTTSFHPCIHFFSFLTSSTHVAKSAIPGLNQPSDTPRHNSPAPPQHFCPPNSGDASCFAVQV